MLPTSVLLRRATSYHFRLLLATNGLLALLLYANTLSGGLVYDDQRAIVSNADVTTDGGLLGDVWTNDFWGVPLRHNGSHKSYRPITTLTFRANYAVHGLHAVGYHLVNVLLYIVLCGQIVQLLTSLDISLLLTTITSLLFTVHPIHSEAVASVVGRADLLAGILFVYAFKRHIDHEGRTDYLLPILALTAVLCKETSIALLPLLIIYDVFVARGFRRSLRSAVFKGVTLVGIMAWRLHMNGFSSRVVSKADNFVAHAPFFVDRTLTFAYMPLVNLGLILAPVKQSYDWSADGIPLVTSPGDGRAMLTFAFYAALMLGTYRLCVARRVVIEEEAEEKAKGRRRTMGIVKRRRTPSPQLDENGNIVKFEEKEVQQENISSEEEVKCTLIGVFIATMGFLPASNLFVHVGFVLAERVLLLPSLGVCLCVGAFLQYVLKRRGHRWILCTIVSIVLLLLAQRTIVRNSVWHDEVSLYASGTHSNPSKAYANLGLIHAQSGRPSEAAKAYRKALELRPNMADTHYNLGVLLQEQRKFGKSIESYRAAIKYRPQLAVAHLNLGAIYEERKQYSASIDILTRCGALSSAGLLDPIAHALTVKLCTYRLALVYATQKRWGAAIQVYMDVMDLLTKGDPLTPAVYVSIAEAYHGAEQEKKSEMWIEMALDEDPKDMKAVLAGADLMRRKGKTPEWEHWLRKAVKLHGDTRATPWMHMAEYYIEEKGDMAAAIDCLLKATHLSPSDPHVLAALGDAYRRDDQMIDAEEFYRRAVQLRQYNAQFWASYGATLHVNKKYELAKHAYDRAVKLNTSDSTTRDNIVKLERLTH